MIAIAESVHSDILELAGRALRMDLDDRSQSLQPHIFIDVNGPQCQHLLYLVFVVLEVMLVTARLVQLKQLRQLFQRFDPSQIVVAFKLTRPAAEQPTELEHQSNSIAETVEIG